MALKDYKCPNCGGALSFDSKLQKLKCQYCDSIFDVDNDTSKDADLNNEQSHVEWEEDANEWQPGESEKLRVYVCKSCGGEIIGDENTAATTCPYCENPVVMSGHLSGTLKPDYVIPFKLDKEAAKKNFAAHLSNKKLLPKVFKKENHIDEIKGIYVPFWLFTTKVKGQFSYSATRVRMWSDSRYNYTETSYFDVARGGEIGFDKVPVDGSAKIDDNLMESIEPFDFSEAVDFKTAYLAGYFADKYDVDKEKSFTRASQRISASTEAAFRNTVIGFSSVMPTGARSNFYDSTVKYALFPVWILNTTWNEKKYVFAMNGQTGKFVGNLPSDKGAMVKYFFKFFFTGLAVVYAIGRLLWHFQIV